MEYESWKCEQCGAATPKEAFALPLPKPNGECFTYVCFDCASRSDVYCREHSIVHKRFSDGTTACLYCIEDAVQTRREYALSVWAGILTVLPATEKRLLIARAIYHALWRGEAEEVTILRFIARRAVRDGCSVEDTLRRIQRDRSVRRVVSE